MARSSNSTILVSGQCLPSDCFPARRQIRASTTGDMAFACARWITLTQVAKLHGNRSFPQKAAIHSCTAWGAPQTDLVQSSLTRDHIDCQVRITNEYRSTVLGRTQSQLERFLNKDRTFTCSFYSLQATKSTCTA